MKYILTLLLVINVAYGQFAPTSSKTKFSQGIGIGSKDTSAFNVLDTMVVTMGRDSIMYYKYKGYWRSIGGSTAAYKLIADTLFNNGYTTRARLKQGLDSLAATKVSSVGLTMPSAFSVAGSPVTTSGTLAVTATGTATQYIRGDGVLATFPSTGAGGSSVYYYLNGSVAASVATYNQMANTAVIGGGTDFNLTGNGLIAQFLTDAGNPNRLEIPGGAWNFEMFFSMSSSGGTPQFYVELLKYNGTTFTSIASSSVVPETISGGTPTDLYLTSLAVPATTLLLTDRLVVRVYIVNNSGGRTATLHTENGNLCQITTTFSGGISALNNLTANNQYFALDSAATGYSIVSASETHTFKFPNMVRVKDTAAMLTPFVQYSDTAYMLSNRLKISDTTNQMSGYQRKNFSLLLQDTATAFGVRPLNNRFLDSIATIRALAQTKGLGTVTSVSGTAGTGISISGSPITSSGTLTITNTAPDQTVALTAGTGIGITGTYPNFTVTNSSPSSGGTVTSVSGTSPISSTGGNTPAISIATASSTVTGALTSTDWNTFNNKLSGNQTITLSGDVSGSGTTAITTTLATVNSTTGSFGSATTIPSFTVNSKGLITAASSTAVIAPAGTLTGTTLANTVVSSSLTSVGALTSGSIPYSLLTGTPSLAYLPLAGGTLTGALSGTSASFSSNGSSFGNALVGSHPLSVQTNVSEQSMKFIGKNDNNNVQFFASDGTTYQSVLGTIGSKFYIGTGASGTERFSISSTGAATFSSNVGLGVTPSAWNSIYKVAEIGTAAIFGTSSYNSAAFSTNVFYNAANSPRYIASDFSNMYWQDDGNHIWYNAPSGTAGNAITFTQAMTLGANGNLLLNTITDNGSKLQVAGSATFSGAVTANGGITANNAASDLQLLIGNGSRDVYISGATGAGTNQMIKFSNVSSANRLSLYEDKLLITSTGAATFSGSLNINGQAKFGNAVNPTALTIHGNYALNLVSNSSGANNITFYAADSTTNNAGIGFSSSSANELWMYNNKIGDILFFATSGVQSLRVNSTSSLFYGGGLTVGAQGNGASGSNFYKLGYGTSGSSRSWRIVQDITANGDLAIQQSTTQTGSTYANALYFDASKNATFAGTATATAFYESSDRRLKNILRRDGDVAYYTLKADPIKTKHIGYIAQEVQATNPDQVKADEKGMLSVNYIEILVQKVRDLEKRIAELENKK